MGKINLRIGHINITDHLILGITKHKFDNKVKEFSHFDLTTVPLVGWPALIKQLEGDELDGAFILAPSAMDLYKSGLKIKTVLLGHRTGSIFIKRKGSGIEKIEDFKGQTIIIPFQLSIHHMLIHKLLSESGLKPGQDVMFETLAPLDMPLALEYGEEDGLGGFIVAEPFGSVSINKGDGDIFKLSKDLWPNHPCCILVMKEEVINNHPDAVQEFVSDLVESGKFAEDQPHEAAQIGADFLSNDKELIHSILTEPKDRIITNNLKPDPDDFDIIQNYMHDKMGVLKDKIDLNQFIDPRFIDNT